MGCISKQSFSKPTRRRERIAVPECGVDAYVYVEEMGARDLQSLRQENYPPKDDAFFDFEYGLLARCLVDDEGKRLFESVDEVRASADLSVTTIQRLAGEALKVSGIDSKKN